MEYINEDAFQNFAHYKINFHRSYGIDPEILRKNAIVYCHTNYIKDFFEAIKFSSNKYILITHGSDFQINESIFNLKTTNVIKWFAINRTYDHPDLISIPVGIYPEYNPDYKKWNDYLSEHCVDLMLKEKDDKYLYCNWDMGNGRERASVLNSLSMRCIWERNLSSTEEWFNTIAQFKFIVSPPGNGIDCHRTWCALYAGSIPIVIKHTLYKDFKGLPILQVNDYKNLSREVLNNFLQQDYSIEKLYMPYWKKLITDEFNKL